MAETPAATARNLSGFLLPAEAAPIEKKVLVLFRPTQSLDLEYAIAIQHSRNDWLSVPTFPGDDARELSVVFWMPLPEIPKTNA